MTDSNPQGISGQPHDFSGWPKWLQNIVRLLPIRAQFVLSGNIRDVHLAPADSDFMLLPLGDFLGEALTRRGYRYILIYDKVDGVKILPDTDAARSAASSDLGISFTEGRHEVSLRALPSLITRLSATRARIAMVIDYASRITGTPESLEEGDLEFFLACQKLSHTSHPVHVTSETGIPLYNPVIWVVDRDTDLPSWFAVGNEAVHGQTIPGPDYETRQSAARVLGSSFAGYSPDAKEAMDSFVRTFADMTNGMSLRSMLAITQLARGENIPLSEIDDAVRCYKLGVIDNPWKKGYLRQKIATAPAFIGQKIKGQERAVTKAVDIMMRSVMGLTGAHASASSSRPKGVLFFAGPTGTGKTELAKTITRLIFGDERSYIRFDMSEFSAEHSDARLIGAPPGYVGYGTGGELTRAIKERPFSVVLFDEIEKGHPRILDKFLQILEDGRLTDGRGETVYFSESIIIFTSNLGIFVENPYGTRHQNVRPEDGYDKVEEKVRHAIGEYFKYSLCRPELLNRIGDNIVVFNFITKDVAGEIFTGMFSSVLARVKDEHGITVTVSDELRERIKALATEDLSNGGRGIGNRLESTFVNPLARALFQMPDLSKRQVIVKDIASTERGYEVALG